MGAVIKPRTYDDWILLGYQVRKGEKATGRDPKTGKATFTRDQVDEPDDGFRAPGPGYQGWDGDR